MTVNQVPGAQIVSARCDDCLHFLQTSSKNDGQFHESRSEAPGRGGRGFLTPELAQINSSD
jgi:hypothetical protein